MVIKEILLYKGMHVFLFSSYIFPFVFFFAFIFFPHHPPVEEADFLELSFHLNTRGHSSSRKIE